MAIATLLQITIFLSVFSAFVEAENLMMNSRKLDETPPLENKCGNCPCDKPCNPTPSPPLPSPPPPPPPPIPKNPPQSNYCPPPPPPASTGQKPAPNPPYIYVNGPPGSVYSVYPYYSGADSLSTGIIPFLIAGIFWLLAF